MNNCYGYSTITSFIMHATYRGSIFFNPANCSRKLLVVRVSLNPTKILMLPGIITNK